MSGKTDTWMPLYIGDYKKDTSNLGAAEHGAYLLLIMHQWVTQAPIPDDDRQLARIACMDSSEWKKARKLVAPFFNIGPDGWSHGRVVKELAAAEKRSETARAKAGKRWGSDAGADATASTGHLSSKQPADAGGMHAACSSPSSNSSNSPQTPVGGFERFWEFYPNKIGIGAARKAYGSALKVASDEVIFAGLGRYRLGKPKDVKWTNPARWLREERWLDMQPTGPVLVSSGPKRPYAEIRAENERIAAASGGSGPKPISSIAPTVLLEVEGFIS